MSPSVGDALPEQFRLLVDQVEEYAIFLLDPDGHVTSWNAGAEKIKGYSEEEILGEHFSVFYPEEEIQSGTPDSALEAAVREGQWVDEGWRIRQDGSRFWARVTITALRKGGSIRGFAKVTRDMTERREQEKKLEREKRETERAWKHARKEAALLRLMEEVATAANDSDTLEEALSRTLTSVCEHTGWPVGHVYWVRRERDPPLVSSDLWHIDDPDQFGDFRAVTEAADFALGKTLPGRVAETGETAWIRDVAGDVNFVRTERVDSTNVKGAFAIPVQVGEETVAVLEFFSGTSAPEDSQLLKAVGAVGEQLSRVAEREKAKRALRESEELFRALSEQSLVGIWLIRDGVYEYANPTFAQYFGYEQEELIGSSPEGIFHPKDWPKVKEKLRNRITGDCKEARYAARGLTRDDEIVHLELYGRRIEYQGAPAIVGTGLDITERRRLEEELLEVQEEEQRRLSRELHDVVGSMLTTATLKVGGLVEAANNGERIAPDELREISEHLSQIGEDVRSVAHGMNPVGIDEGLSPALQKLVNQAEASGGPSCTANLQTSASDLPDDTATQLYRIAQEALNNALKHADADHIQVTLEKTSDADQEDMLALTIRDDGEGMSSSSTEEGLGMRTMRHRANVVDGTLSIEQFPEGGMIVRCRVPIPTRQ